MLRNNALFSEKRYRRMQFWCVQALGVHQHTLLSFKNTINFQQKFKPKYALICFIFWKKLEKSPQRWGFHLQIPIGLRRLGTLPPDLHVVIPLNLRVIF